MVDVFISYSRENKARVADIVAAVTAAGYDVWWDAELPPHRSYGDVITEKIGSAKAAIVVWCRLRPRPNGCAPRPMSRATRKSWCRPQSTT